VERVIDRNSCPRVRPVSFRATANLLALGQRERKGIRPRLRFGSNAIPEIFDELETLVKTQVEEVGNSDRVHGSMVAPEKQEDQVAARNSRL
jgi:hypothetical protein